MLRSHSHETRINDWVNDRGRVRDLLVGFLICTLEPGLDVEVPWAVEGDGVAVEEVGHHHKVAVCGELVGLDRTGE
jgi:hypothetical protein